MIKKDIDLIPRYYPEPVTSNLYQTGRGGYLQFLDLSIKSAQAWHSAVEEMEDKLGFEYCDTQPADKRKVNINILLPTDTDINNRLETIQKLQARVDELKHR